MIQVTYDHGGHACKYEGQEVVRRFYTQPGGGVELPKMMCEEHLDMAHYMLELRIVRIEKI